MTLPADVAEAVCGTEHAQAGGFGRERPGHRSPAVFQEKRPVVGVEARGGGDASSLHGHKVRLLREFDPDPGDFQVPDPYYQGRFDHVYAIVERTARALLDRLVEEHDLAGEEGSG